jgi:hypothetical protein
MNHGSIISVAEPEKYKYTKDNRADKVNPYMIDFECLFRSLNELRVYAPAYARHIGLMMAKNKTSRHISCGDVSCRFPGRK